MTIAQALPQQAFPGMEQVVPALADAVSTTGKANVVLVAPTQDASNALKEGLKDAFRADAAAGASADEVNAAAGRLGNIDVAVIDVRGVKNPDAVAGAQRLQGAPKVIIIEDKTSPYAAAEMTSELVNTIVAGSGPVAGRPARRRRSTRPAPAPGRRALDEKVSEAYAQRAAQLLERLAISRGQVLDVSVASAALHAGAGRPPPRDRQEHGRRPGSDQLQGSPERAGEQGAGREDGQRPQDRLPQGHIPQRASSSATSSIRT